ncbi:MAG: glycoside hydrolase family 5 protein [Fibromonadaceae bacterium]|nr:glycoside hydrolase family 5 protein [Fibromonadaceae bacterium]
MRYLFVAAFGIVFFACSGGEGGGVVEIPEQAAGSSSSSFGENSGNLSSSSGGDVCPDTEGSSSSSESDDWKYTGAKEIAACPIASTVAGPVSFYGRLQARGAFIDGVKGTATVEEVQVRGVSFGWSNTGWESERFYSANAVERMVKDWKAEIVRAAYGEHNAANRSRIKTIVDAAIENDIYVIIDFHSHNAHNQVAESNGFFEEMAKTYGGCNNVIFEIYNEPNCLDGSDVNGCTKTTWTEIKKYAKEVIPVIRKYSENLVLVGTPSWSRYVQQVVGNAINDENVGYVLHFYSESHSLSGNRGNVNRALCAGLPIFVTEYGTTNADGGQCKPSIDNCTGSNSTYGSHSAVKSDEWHAYMDSKKISSVAWNINDKKEGSAFFGVTQKGFGEAVQAVEANWRDTEKMTASGKYIFEKLNDYYLSKRWD